jgi:diguanylate cyclase
MTPHEEINPFRDARGKLVPLTPEILVSTAHRLFGRRALFAQQLAAKDAQIADLTGQLAQSRIDPVTGVPTRAALEHTYTSLTVGSSELRRSTDNTPLDHENHAALMIDVDRFKQVNDRYGHAVGDTVLRGIGSTIRDSVRQRDQVARYGGEEFAVILPRTGLEDAETIGEKIRTAVESSTFEDPSMTITVSVGVGRLLLGADAGAGFVDADRAVYAAKDGGRNMVVVSNKLPPLGD